MTPEHPDFYQWLLKPPPDWRQQRAKVAGFAFTPENSVLTPVTNAQLNELIFDAGLFWDETETNLDELEEETYLYYPEYA